MGLPERFAMRIEYPDRIAGHRVACVRNVGPKDPGMPRVEAVRAFS